MLAGVPFEAVLPHFVWFRDREHRVCYLRGCARNRNGHPAQGSTYWVSHSNLMEIGLSQHQRNQWEFAQIAIREVIIGTVGAVARFKTCQLRVKW